MIRHRRRGSSLFLVISVIVSLTLIIMASAEVGMAAERNYQRHYREVVSKAAFLGVKETVKSQGAGQTLAAGSASITFGSQTAAYKVTDTDATIRRTYMVDSSVDVDGYTYSDSERVAGRQPAHPVYYAMFAGGNINDYGNALTTYSSDNGAVHANGTLTLGSSTTVNGDISAGTLSSSATTSERTQANKNISTGLVSDLSTLLPVTYLPEASTTYLFGASLTNVSFGSVAATSPYPLIYVVGNLTLKGSITGQGTIAVLGNVRLNGDISYTTLSSKLVVIASGSLTINGGSNSIVGTYYMGGSIDMSNVSTMSGNLISMTDITLNKPLSLTADRTFWNDRNEAFRQRIPGFWPTTSVTGLMR